MLVTKQPVFRRFWYPVMPQSQLGDRPQAFELLGEAIVLWKDGEGSPVAVVDRCCHRSAKLSLGKVVEGSICCPYHGWTFDGTGRCVRFPQGQNGSIPASYRVESYRCRERYGYIWVCMGEAIAEIPEISEARDCSFRLIPEFYERWNCAGLRVMENELDLAHPTFVHTGTFGSEEHPVPDWMELNETDYGLHYRAYLGVTNSEQQQQNLKLAENKTVRNLEMMWFLPFTVKLRIEYPNGLVHIVVNTMTPIRDSVSQMVQFCLRNDTESDANSSEVVAFDRAVTLEDKRILESTDYDVPLELSQEQHMLTDRPGILMRKRLASLLKEYGEVEQTRGNAK